MYRQVEYIALRVYIDDCTMEFPPKWDVLTDAVSIAMRVCNDPRNSNDEALDALQNADAVFEVIGTYWDRGRNFSSGTSAERLSFLNVRHEIHLMMLDRGVTSDHYTG